MSGVGDDPYGQGYTPPPPMQPPAYPQPEYPGYQPYPPPYGYGYPPPPYGYPPYQPGPAGPKRPGLVLAASVLDYVCAGLLIIAGMLLLFGASVVSSLDSTGVTGNSYGVELALDGMVDLAVAGLLIAGGVMFTGGRSTGRILSTIGNVVVVVVAIYWFTRFDTVNVGGLVFWGVIFLLLSLATLAFSFTTPSANGWRTPSRPSAEASPTMSSPEPPPEETLAVGREQGRSGPGGRGLLVLVLVVAVGAVAFFVGRQTSGTSTPAARVSVSASLPRPSARLVPMISGLAADGPTCSRQVGDRLQLGLRLANGFDDAVTLLGVDPILPGSGGLQAGTPRVGVCGQAGSLRRPAGDQVPAHSEVWLVTWFRVLVPCPVPYPVQFSLRYGRDGQHHSVLLTPFPDLGQVPYSGCATPSR